VVDVLLHADPAERRHLRDDARGLLCRGRAPLRRSRLDGGRALRRRFLRSLLGRLLRRHQSRIAATAHAFDARMRAASSAAALTRWPILACSGSTSGGSPSARNAALQTGPIDATTPPRKLALTRSAMASPSATSRASATCV